MADQPTQEQLQAIARDKQRTIEQAFAVVFGHPNRRTAEQEIVWGHMKSAGFEDRPLLVRPLDALQTAADAANHDLWVRIKNLVAAGWTPEAPGNQPTTQAVRDQ